MLQNRQLVFGSGQLLRKGLLGRKKLVLFVLELGVKSGELIQFVLFLVGVLSQSLQFDFLAVDFLPQLVSELLSFLSDVGLHFQLDVLLTDFIHLVV